MHARASCDPLDYQSPHRFWMCWGKRACWLKVPGSTSYSPLRGISCRLLVSVCLGFDRHLYLSLWHRMLD
jgi:hypothetical protein